MGSRKKYFVIGLSILGGFLIWVLDAVLDYFIFFEGTFLDLLVFDIPEHELYIRSLILVIFFIFGLICAWIIGRLENSEENLRKKGEELAILNKELDAFNYSVSQDLKVPLRHIQGYCELIAEHHGDELNEETRYFFTKASEAIGQMRVLVDNLIQLSKAAIYEVRRESIDLSRMMQQISRDLQAWDPASKVEFEIGREIFGNGDETLMRIALFSLVGKAWKLGNSAEQAAIKFDSVEREKQTSVLEQRGTDVDIGEINALLDPLHHLQWDPDEEALGLTVAARIIRRHGGEIWAERLEERTIAILFTLSDDTSGHGDSPSFIH